MNEKLEVATVCEAVDKKEWKTGRVFISLKELADMGQIGFIYHLA